MWESWEGGRLREKKSAALFWVESLQRKAEVVHWTESWNATPSRSEGDLTQNLVTCPGGQGLAQILESRRLCEFSCIECPSSSVLTKVIRPEGLREAGLDVGRILGLGHWWEGLIGKKVLWQSWTNSNFWFIVLSIFRGCRVLYSL